MNVPVHLRPDETFVLNLGPQHPATHGVLRVKLTMDGEYIVHAEPVLGYTHRTAHGLHQPDGYVDAVMAATVRPAPGPLKPPPSSLAVPAPAAAALQTPARPHAPAPAPAAAGRSLP